MCGRDMQEDMTDIDIQGPSDLLDRIRTIAFEIDCTCGQTLSISTHDGYRPPPKASPKCVS